MARPRNSGIPRFNFPTQMQGNSQFLTFRRKLHLKPADTALAMGYLSCFIEYVSTNCAWTGNVAGADPVEIAEACWYTGDAEAFMRALREAQIIDAAGDVQGWLEADGIFFQPYALKIIKQRSSEAEAQQNQQPAPVSVPSTSVSESKTRDNSTVSESKTTPKQNQNQNLKDNDALHHQKSDSKSTLRNGKLMIPDDLVYLVEQTLSFFRLRASDPEARQLIKCIISFEKQIGIDPIERALVDTKEACASAKFEVNRPIAYFVALVQKRFDLKSQRTIEGALAEVGDADEE